MIIKPVDRLPEKNRNPMPKKNLNNIIAEFMRMNVKHAEISFDRTEYCSVMAAYHSFKKYSLYYGEYPIKVTIACDKLYLTRTDMED